MKIRQNNLLYFSLFLVAIPLCFPLFPFAVVPSRHLLCQLLVVLEYKLKTLIRYLRRSGWIFASSPSITSVLPCSRADATYGSIPNSFFYVETEKPTPRVAKVGARQDCPLHISAADERMVHRPKALHSSWYAHFFLNSQNATALAAATLRESTPFDIGMITL